MPEIPVSSNLPTPTNMDIVIPSTELGKSAQTLPDFLKEEAIHIVRTGKNFRFDRRFIRNGLVHLSFFAGFILPFAHTLIPYIIWRIRSKRNDDALADDAMKAFNFQLTCTIYMMVFVLLTTGIGLISYPFIKELSGITGVDRETPLTVMVPTVILPALSIYLFMWMFFSCRVAFERMRGRPAHYPTSISFISPNKDLEV